MFRDGARQQLHIAIQARALRAQLFGSELFLNPAWDIILELHRQVLDDVPFCLESVSAAAGLRPASTLRWIAALNQRGLVVHHMLPPDILRVQLTGKGLNSIESYFRRLSEIAGPGVSN